MNAGHSAKAVEKTMKSTMTTPANLDFLSDLRSKYPHQPVYVVPLGLIVQIPNAIDKHASDKLFFPLALVIMM